MLNITAIPALRDNYIWLISLGRQAVVVDPGEAEPVLHALRDNGLQLAAILLTHHHADHTGGLSALTASAPLMEIILRFFEIISGEFTRCTGRNRTSLLPSSQS